MKEKLEITDEEQYEQFETGEIKSSKKSKHSKKFLSIKQYIKYTLLTFTILCFVIFLFNITSNPSSSPKNKIESPIEKLPLKKKCDIGFKNVGDKCVIDYAIKGTYVTHKDNEEIHLLGFVPDFPLRMTIDGKIVESTKSFTFPKKGEHTVLIKSNFTKLTSARRMFYKVRNLVKLEFTHLFDTKNVKDMRSMFYECWDLTSIDLSHFNTINVENMELVFAGCNKLKSIDLSHFNTKKVNSMANLFEDCRNLTKINLSNFDTSEVKEMGFMFFGCSSLVSLCRLMPTSLTIISIASKVAIMKRDSDR